MMNPKKTLATVWLDGCSGCHMSFLDIDERLLDLAAGIELVFSPLVDPKTFPDHVDIVLVEGAVSTDEDERKIKKVREHCGILVALGDCAVTANVPSMRNRYKVEDILACAYQGDAPHEDLPQLLRIVRPVHTVVKVDVYVPGCPPHADTIYYILAELLAGRVPDPNQMTHFGA